MLMFVLGCGERDGEGLEFFIFEFRLIRLFLCFYKETDSMLNLFFFYFLALREI